MKDVWKVENSEDLRAKKWSRSWESAWVYAAAFALLVLIGLSKVLMVNGVAETLN